MFKCIMGKTLPLFAEKYEKLLQCKSASLFIAKKKFSSLVFKCTGRVIKYWTNNFIKLMML